MCKELSSVSQSENSLIIPHPSNKFTSHFRFIFPLLAAFSLCFTGSIYAATTEVLCGGSDDTSAIQTAINNANTGDTIELVGYCQLNGTSVSVNTSNITIEGAGAAGNWSTVISGLTDSSGLALGDGPAPTFQYYNRAFSLGPVQNVTIQGIKFENLNRAISISPSIVGNSLLCSNTTVTSAEATDISVNNNWFDNDQRAVSIFGSDGSISVLNNLITNSGYSQADIAAEGLFQACLVPNDSGGFNYIEMSIGVVNALHLNNNYINNDYVFYPMLAQNINNEDIKNNSIKGGTNDILSIVFNAPQAIVSQNVVDGGGVAAVGIFDNIQIAADNNGNPFLVPYSSMTNTITNNKISNVALAGIGLDSAVFGTSVINNTFDSSGVINIFLCDATSSANVIAENICDGGYAPGPGGSSVVASNNNKIITTNFANTVMDFGFQNKLLGTQNLWNNTNVPSTVKVNLMQRIKGKPLLP